MIQHIHPTNSKHIYEKINSHIYHQPRHSYPFVVVRTEANADPDLMYTINSISRDPLDNIKCGMFSKPPKIWLSNSEKCWKCCHDETRHICYF